MPTEKLSCIPYFPTVTMKPKPWLAAIIPKKRKLSPRLTHSAFKTMRIVHKMDIL